jgi:hypothetical protein
LRASQTPVSVRASSPHPDLLNVTSPALEPKMRSSNALYIPLLALLAACGTDETTVPDDDGSTTGTDGGGADGGVDAACTDGDERMEDCNRCICEDGVWGCTEMGCPDTGDDVAPDTIDVGPDVVPGCTDGDERMEDCNRCECLDGAWSCTEMACEDTGTDAGEDVEPDIVPDVDTADIDDVDACLFACGVGCPAPEFQLCGTDGELYCNECIMGCYGVALADTTFECAAPCELPATGDEAPATEWTPPELCPPPFPGPFGEGGSFLVMTDETEFGESGICPEGTSSGIDWSSQRLVRAVVSDNPSGSLLGLRKDGGTITVYLTAPAYCGGVRPPSSFFYLLLPVATDEVTQNVCIQGACQGPPRP